MTYLAGVLLIIAAIYWSFIQKQDYQETANEFWNKRGFELYGENDKRPKGE